MEFLLSKGADPSVTNSAGDNALHVAARHANAACIQKMLAAPAHVKGLPCACLSEVLCEDAITKFIDLPNGAALLLLSTRCHSMLQLLRSNAGTPGTCSTPCSLFPTH